MRTSKIPVSMSMTKSIKCTDQISHHTQKKTIICLFTIICWSGAQTIIMTHFSHTSQSDIIGHPGWKCYILFLFLFNHRCYVADAEPRFINKSCCFTLNILSTYGIFLFSIIFHPFSSRCVIHYHQSQSHQGHIVVQCTLTHIYHS